jgi:CRISPR-associated endonuclease Csn1
MHNDTAYGLLGAGRVQVRKRVDGVRIREVSALKVLEFADPHAHPRHGLLPNGGPRPYKGYKGDSNHCMEIVRNDKGKWEGEVVSTFEAYELVRQHGLARLRHPMLSVSGKPLVMRLMIGDTLALTSNDEQK